jgi:hypothetical protein
MFQHILINGPERYILYRVNIQQDTRPMTIIDYMIKITETLANEGKNYATGPPGTDGIWEMAQNN